MRRFNWPLWIGFIVVLFAFVTYLPLFVRFVATRDVPWATYLIFAAGLVLVAIGFRRAQRKVAASIVTILSVAITGFFVFGANFGTRIPASPSAPAVGAKAPDFTLPDTNGKPVALAQLLAAPGAKGVMLVFYRGYW
jgi:hypothetical protein